jgi:hypothetical protein
MLKFDLLCDCNKMQGVNDLLYAYMPVCKCCIIF